MKANRLYSRFGGYRAIAPITIIPIVIGMLIISMLTASCAGPVLKASGGGPAAYLDAVRNDPVKLEQFAREIPKGGDLHTHLSGIIYAESYLRWAAQDDMCINTSSWQIGPGPCGAGSTPVSSVLADKALTAKAVDTLSMRNFPLNPPVFGHNHFFATFSLFGATSSRHMGEMLAEAATRAAADNTDYLELLLGIQSAELRSLAESKAWTGDMETDYRALIGGVRGLLAQGTSQIDRAVAKERADLACDGPAPAKGCAVTIRFIQEGNRTASNQLSVFASLIFGAELAARDPRMVGVDLVAPEDNPTALANYRLHMQMLAFLKAKYPSLNVALHAGELTPGFAKPADLSFHITEAVGTAGARRIGHGVSIKSEPGWEALLKSMARDRVGVAINLTSNAQILGIAGEAHPFRSYMSSGVPVMISTDDQGVSRGSHTAEYMRAITTYGLKWNDVKRLTRNSLEQAFIRGTSLWKEYGESPVPVDACASDSPGSALPSPACAAYLNANDKAAEQWRLEGKLAAFENKRW